MNPSAEAAAITAAATEPKRLTIEEEADEEVKALVNKYATKENGDYGIRLLNVIASKLLSNILSHAMMVTHRNVDELFKPISQDIRRKALKKYNKFTKRRH